MTASDVDFSEMTSVNLDEYVGLGGEDEQSYRYFMNAHLFNKNHSKKPSYQTAKREDLEAECQRYDSVIVDHPVDIQIWVLDKTDISASTNLVHPLKTTSVVDLTESTINANKRYFDKVEDVPTTAISMGIGSIAKQKNHFDGIWRSQSGCDPKND